MLVDNVRTKPACLQRDTAMQVAMCSGIDQGSHFGFQQRFQRATAPFHRYAEELPFVDDGVGDQLVAHAGMTDLALLALAHAGQAGQRRMQAHRIAAHQVFGLRSSCCSSAGLA
jgi:hypothetical protein